MTRRPGEPLARNAMALVADANTRIKTLSVDDAAAMLGDESVHFIDIRDPRELERDGTIEGATSAPRGMLEFWIDPESPYYKPKLDDGRTLVLFCGGGWRSALAAATLVDMGRGDVAHIDGGFAAWRAANRPVVEYRR